MTLRASINKKENEDSKIGFLMRNGLAIVLAVAFVAFIFIAQSSANDPPADDHTHLKTIRPYSVDDNADNSNLGTVEDSTDDQVVVPSPATSPSSTEDNTGSAGASADAATWTGALKEKFGGDLLDRNELVRLAKLGKEKLIDDLRVAYGEYFDDIFIGEGKSFTPISDGGESLDRLKRKFMIKVLSMQEEVVRQQKAASGTSGRHLVEVDDYFGRYVWATGGHSAAAGHGNLFNESYTAYMGTDIRKVFGAVGIYFDDRNYAMGGTPSASEISMCWAQIFGTDVDFFSWDYGMTDGNFPVRLLHFGYRGGISPGRPAFLGMRVDGRTKAQREQALRDLEGLGMASFEGSQGSYRLRNDAIPDSASLSGEELEKLPPLLKNLKCGTSIESGEPFCDRDKYTKDVCARRAKQASWHPGFKSHAMDGHALALFLADVFIQSLEDLAASSVTDIAQLLDQLKKDDEALWRSLLTGDLPSTAHSLFTLEDESSNVTIPTEVLWKGPSLCRTARLPAESRYLGYTTNTDKVGRITVLGTEQYDVGLELKAAKDPDAMKDGIRLTYEPGGKERETCEVVLKPDYKDFFYVNQGHGASTISIPNEKEVAAYLYDHEKMCGVIVIFFLPCDWGKCTNGQLSADDFREGKFSANVNNKPVTDIVSIGFEAWVLKGNNGVKWDPNDSGTYDIEFDVTADNAFLVISSIVIY